MKKCLLPVWVILFSTAAIALMSAHVRSDDSLLSGVTSQLSADQPTDTSASPAETPASGASGSQSKTTPAATTAPKQDQPAAQQQDSGGKKGGCCG